MSGGFSFPPPPPPPPKPQDNFNLNQVDRRDGFRGRGAIRGRGFDGRGRGGFRNGEQQGYRPNTHGQHLNSGHQGSSWKSQSSNSSQLRQDYDTAPTSLPPGAHINPNFHRAHPRDSVPDGYSGFRSNPPPNGDGPRQYGAHQHQDSFAGSPPRTTAGHKRKLDALRGPQDRNEATSSVHVAPSVPSFGSSVVPSGASSYSKQSSVNTNQDRLAAGKTGRNVFGLTPGQGDAEYSSSDDGDGDKDADEEAMFAALGTKLVFEYEGTVMSLNSEADLAKWQQERRRKWPTDARVAEKQSERRQQGEERKRLLAAAPLLTGTAYGRAPRISTTDTGNPAGPSQTPLRQVKPGQQSDHVQQDTVTQLDDKVEPEPANRNVALEEPAKETPFKPLPGISMEDSEDESENQGEQANAPTISQGADPHLNPASESGSDAALDDEPPEEVSSKVPLRAASIADRPACRYFFASGRCRDGDDCRYRHEASTNRPFVAPPQEQSKSKMRNKTEFGDRVQRKGIRQLLLDQEQTAANRLTLQVIKYLGGKGFFNAETASNI